ncbi:MAG: YihY/virulence factor BrkB family protein [Acidimicrobiia bacterium]|nr:YihY/virulence factor BrkB family protein [Acidimicrobiia bacterium]
MRSSLRGESRTCRRVRCCWCTASGGAAARRPWLNHLVRAASHYASRQADLLAAGITYFGLLALFPVILLAVPIAGAVLSGQPELLRALILQIQVAVAGELGVDLVDAVLVALDQRGVIGVIGLLGLLYAGIGWLSKLRLAMQMIWRGTPDEPSFVKDFIQDLLSLLGLGGAILASLALTALATGLTSFVIDLVGLSEVPGIGVVTALLGILIAIAGGTPIFLWLFIRLPHVDAPVRALILDLVRLVARRHGGHHRGGGSA